MLTKPAGLPSVLRKEMSKTTPPMRRGNSVGGARKVLLANDYLSQPLSDDYPTRIPKVETPAQRPTLESLQN